MSGFSQFSLDPLILRALEKMQFRDPTPIQEKTMEPILQGKDIIALAETGSGKTAACAIPLCNQVDTAQKSLQVLIIVPTRELALQYAEQTQKIGKEKGVIVFSMLGGESMDLQRVKIEHGVQVLISTPGRLIDFIYERSIDLSTVRTLVLDEADEMLDQGFRDDLEFIIQCLVQEHQTLLFSATMPKTIKDIALLHMREPQEINLVSEKRSPAKIDHHFHFCKPQEKGARLKQFLKDFAPKKAIIFCHTRREVEALHQKLVQDFGKSVDFIHAGLSQDVRRIVSNKFRKGAIQFLIGTDVLARGLDFSDVSHVFIYQLSDSADVYVHRSGRTGRYYSEGMSITLVTPRDLGKLRKVLHMIQKEPLWIGDPPREFSGEKKKKEGQKLQEKAPREAKEKSPKPPPKKTVNPDLLKPPSTLINLKKP